MQVKLLDLITHEPQSEWQGAFIVSFCFQEVLSNSEDLVHCSNSIRQRQRPGFHLKLHILKLQCHGFTLQKENKIFKIVMIMPIHCLTTSKLKAQSMTLNGRATNRRKEGICVICHISDWFVRVHLVRNTAQSAFTVMWSSPRETFPRLIVAPAVSLMALHFLQLSRPHRDSGRGVMVVPSHPVFSLLICKGMNRLR